jgi:hypothetical protein
MFRSKFLMAATVAAIAALAGPATSQAGFTIHISDDLGNIPFNAVVGGNSYNNNTIVMGGLKINITLTSNAPGNNSNSQVDTAAISVSTTAGGIPATKLTISVISDTFLNAPGLVGATLFTSMGFSNLQNLGITPTATASGFSTINGLHVVGSDVSVPDVLGSSTSSVPLFVASPYTLGNTMILDLHAYSGEPTGQANVNITSFLDGQGNFQITPAPAGLILAATALPFVGLLRRRLRKPEATTAA